MSPAQSKDRTILLELAEAYSAMAANLRAEIAVTLSSSLKRLLECDALEYEAQAAACRRDAGAASV